MNFGQELRKKRERKEISRAELHRLTGISYSRLGDYEINKGISEMAIGRAMILSETLDWPLEKLAAAIKGTK